MTAQILSSELAVLIQDSKRKAPEIRSAAEKSLSDLKSLPNTSESQLAADLKRRPLFVKPFVLSCASKNPKLAATSIACLQRLVVFNGLPHESLEDVLSGLRDCTSLTQDIQLKILQLLPSLLQNYASLIAGHLLSKALHTCFLLLASKTGVISHTAAATVQQLVVSVFDKVQQEDESQSEDYVLDVPSENGDISVQKSALDAYLLLNDLCLLSEGRPPEFLHDVSASPNFCLELIEAVFSNHAGVVNSHPEQIHVIRLKLMPFMIRVLSDRLQFSTTVRSMRLLPVIFTNLLNVLVSECEVLLSLLCHILEPDTSVQWKRVLCMEVLRSVYADPALVRHIFSTFDLQEGKREIIRDQMSLLVNMSSEKPTVIGLGQQSTIPSTDQNDEGMDQMAALQVEGISGTIGVAMTLKSSTAPGISARLSSMRVSCLEQLDKSEAPSVPPAYIYSLVLTCLNSFSEGLARFLLPFTVPGDKGRRKARGKDETSSLRNQGREALEERPQLQRTSSASFKFPVNPLDLRHHALYSQIQTSASLVEACWPPLLAAYSIFLHAALDHEYYRDLVRSLQKFTQIAGLLHLSTPRDAFLTTLGKNAVPSGSNMLESGAVNSNSELGGHASSESLTSVSDKAISNKDTSNASLNSRNLLCLRALLNLGIALGPVLGRAWVIIFGTLQQANIIINHILLARQKGHGNYTASSSNENDFLGDIGDQISAVNATAHRLIESTVDLPSESYTRVVEALCSLFRGVTANDTQPKTPLSATMPVTPTSHQRGHSISGSLVVLTFDSRMDLFVIEQLNSLVRNNGSRFLDGTVQESGWLLLSESLQNVASAQNLDANIRVRAAKVLTEVVDVISTPVDKSKSPEDIRYRALCVMAKLINDIYDCAGPVSFSPRDCEVEIHSLLLETLHRSLEQYGESLKMGWSEVLMIINSVFKDQGYAIDTDQKLEIPFPRVRGTKLIRTAFSSLQLICSDFLASLPKIFQLSLLRTISAFCAQREEFNISLTSTTLFCNFSEYLWEDKAVVSIDPSFGKDSLSGSEVSGDYSRPSVWFYLLQALVQSTVDERTEVRRGSVHSVFRILDGCTDRLDLQSWINCQRTILLQCLQKNKDCYSKSREKNPVVVEDTSAWNETCIMILDHLPETFGIDLSGIFEMESFELLWNTLMNQLHALLKRQVLTVSSAVFDTLVKITIELSSDVEGFRRHATSLWNLWNNSNPADHDAFPKKSIGNQDALLAYTKFFAALYPHVAQEMDNKKVQTSLQQLKRCVLASSPASYSSDIDKLSPLQSQVVACIKAFKTQSVDSIVSVGNLLSALSSIALERDNSNPEMKGPTFIALSKLSIDLLKDHIVLHSSCKELYTSEVLTGALDALGLSIRLKYKGEQSKEPQLWKKATQAIVDILTSTMRYLGSVSISKEVVDSIWETILRSYTFVLAAPEETANQIQQALADQTFDIDAFRKLTDLIIPSIIERQCPDLNLEIILAKTLFDHSIVHEPHPDDLPAPGDEYRKPLMSLSTKHIGRTDDIKPAMRSKMSYEVMEKLIEITDIRGAGTGSTYSQRQRLAIAATPFLILRVGLSLKAYALDQPLRGRMPQPESQRKELLYLLRRLTELESDPKAFDHFYAGEDPMPRGKKNHLLILQQFIIQAVTVTKSDDELRRTLTHALTIMSNAMGTFNLSIKSPSQIRQIT